MISSGYANFIVEVEITWVQDPKSSSEPSQRLLTYALNISSRTKITQNKIIVHNKFSHEQLM